MKFFGPPRPERVLLRRNTLYLYSSDLDQKRSGVLLVKVNQKENGTESQNWWWSNSEKADTQFSVPRVLCQGTLKSRGGGKLSTHFCADLETIKTVFRTIISVNQLSIYGAVLDLCEEFKTCQARTGRRVLAGQCIPLSEPASLLVKRPTPSTDDPAQEDLLKKYQGRVERLSQQNREIQFCTDAGFQTTVGVGQYFMTNTIHRSSGLSWVHFAKIWKNHLTRKVGFEGTPR